MGGVGILLPVGFFTLICALAFHQKEQLSSYTISLLAGSLGGFISSALFYPLDTVEARQQMDKQLQNKTLWESIQFILQQEGWGGFYIGWQPGIYGITVNWAVYFLIYDSIKQYLMNINSTSITIVDLWSGVFAGILTSAIVNPFWVVKAKMITRFSFQYEKQDKKKKNQQHITTYDTIHQLYQVEGISAFYKGVVVSMSGCLQGAIQFMLYEHLVSFLSSIIQYKPILYFTSGSLSNCIATIITFPYLTIRAAYQTGKNIRSILHTNGWQGFYAGLQANLIRQIPTAGTMLLVMEGVRYVLNE